MTAHITIDGRPMEVDEGSTVLQAARQNGVYIPTLCDYPSLPPHGSCRLCIVEIEGNPKTPASCTTPVQSGMVVRTNTPRLRAMRTELLRLLLSEHPLSCMICPEKGNCEECMATLRKSGVTTGCRSCAKDGNCELLDVVDYIGLGDDIHPVHYRNLPVERNDPFFDRDYNLCVHCGRCMRICENLYFVGTLTYTHRGSGSLVGTAFGRNHIEAGCSFCGSCVEVCPTGALAEKMRKWDGAPEQEVVSTCPFCSLGCSIRLLTRHQEVIGSLPVNLTGEGHLCVKGRFGITELVSHSERLRSPKKLVDSRLISVGWDEAVSQVAETLAACPPDAFAMRLSADLSTEDLYVAQKFARTVMGTHQVTSAPAETYGAGLNSVLRLVKNAASLDALSDAGAILCLGLNTRYAQSVVETELLKARQRGAKIYTIHPYWHSLSLQADGWLQQAPGQLVGLFDMLARMVSGEPTVELEGLDKRLTAELPKLAQELRAARNLVVLVGVETLCHPENARILASVERLAHLTGASVIPLVPQGNLAGSFLAGTYPELLPGGVSSSNDENRRQVAQRWGRPLPEPTPSSDPHVLYLIGVPPPDGTEATVLYQNIDAPPQGSHVDLLLSAASFTEADGTMVDLEGRVQELRCAVPPPGEAIPSWEILCRIARAMRAQGFDFTNAGEIRAEMASLIDGYQPGARLSLDQLSPAFPEPQLTAEPRMVAKGKWSFILTTRVTANTYMGYPLSRRVAGLRDLLTEESLSINPEDAQVAGIAPGDSVMVRTPHFERAWPAKLDPRQQLKTLLVTLKTPDAVGAVITPAEIRTTHVPAD